MQAGSSSIVLSLLISLCTTVTVVKAGLPSLGPVKLVNCKVTSRISDEDGLQYCPGNKIFNRMHCSG
eukprot:Awhi_evm2s12081